MPLCLHGSKIQQPLYHVSIALFTQQLVVATGGIGGPEKTFKFPQALPHEPHNLCLFEHVEGCKICSELYGHYLMPSGRLAHFYIGDTVRKGHRVDLIQPPEVPFETRVSEQLPHYSQ